MADVPAEAPPASRPKGAEDALARDVLLAARYYLGGRRGLLALVAAAAVIGLALNWSWLVAAGLAPILIAILPCALMCGLGLCMSRMMGRSCQSDMQRPDRVERPSPGFGRLPTTNGAASRNVAASSAEAAGRPAPPDALDTPVSPADGAEILASADSKPKGDDNA